MHFSKYKTDYKNVNFVFNDELLYLRYLELKLVKMNSNYFLHFVEITGIYTADKG